MGSNVKDFTSDEIKKIVARAHKLMDKAAAEPLEKFYSYGEIGKKENFISFLEGKCSPTSLNLRNSLESQGITKLAAALRINKSITSIDLSDNSNAIDYGAVLTLSIAVMNHPSITSLNLNGLNGRLDSDSAALLAMMIKANKNIAYMDLSGGNRIGESGFRLIADAIKENKSITSFIYDSQIQMYEILRYGKDLPNTPHVDIMKSLNFNSFLNSLAQKMLGGGFLKDAEIKLIVENQVNKPISPKMIENFAEVLQTNIDVTTYISQYLNFWEIVKGIQKRTYKVVEKIAELKTGNSHNHFHESNGENVHSLQADTKLLNFIVKKNSYHEDVETLNSILAKYNINKPLETLFQEKEFKKILLKLHPDKGGNGEDFTTVINIKEKFNEDISIQTIAGEGIQPAIHNTIWGFKFVDTLVDTVRLVREPTFPHVKKMLINVGYLSSITHGATELPLIVSFLDIMYSFHQAEYSKAIGQIAIFTGYAMVPLLTKSMEIPYLESIYGISMAAFSGYTAFTNLYSLYLECGAEDASLKSAAAYKNLSQTLYNPLLQQYDFARSGEEYEDEIAQANDSTLNDSYSDDYYMKEENTELNYNNDNNVAENFII